MPKEKRYFFNVVEEMIMNPKFDGYRAGRIEVYDSKAKSGYACYKARFLIPEEFIVDFKKLWDFKRSDPLSILFWTLTGLSLALNTVLAPIPERHK